MAPEEAVGDGFASAHAGGHHAVSGLVSRKEERRRIKEFKKAIRAEKKRVGEGDN